MIFLVLIIAFRLQLFNAPLWSPALTLGLPETFSFFPRDPSSFHSESELASNARGLFPLLQGKAKIEFLI